MAGERSGVGTHERTHVCVSVWMPGATRAWRRACTQVRDACPSDWPARAVVEPHGASGFEDVRRSCAVTTFTSEYDSVSHGLNKSQ